eukprot:5064172-Pyramimonas_sp.AAC.1
MTSGSPRTPALTHEGSALVPKRQIMILHGYRYISSREHRKPQATVSIPEVVSMGISDRGHAS